MSISGEKKSAMIDLSGVAKSFVLHNQGGAVIPVMAGPGCGWRRANAWR